MAFNGKWELESRDGFDEFCKLLGVPIEFIEKGRNVKLTTEVVQNGNDFTWTQVFANNTRTNKFTIGQECDMTNIANNEFKATPQMDGGKLLIQYPKYLQTSEISGGKLVTTCAIGNVVMTRTSKKL